MTKLIKPDFLCIGAQKSGTTWLYNILEHSDHVRMPPYKELHFFDYIDLKLPNKLSDKNKANHFLIKRWTNLFDKIYYDSDAIPCKDKEWYKKYIHLIREMSDNSLKGYSELFEKNYITGDITPAYSILSPHMVKSISDYFPKTKIILILRNPIFRDWSMCKMYFKNRHNLAAENTNKTKLIENYLVKPYKRSNYNYMINTWSKYFNGRFKIFYYDDLVESPINFLSDIASYLNIPHNQSINKFATERIFSSNTAKFPLQYKKLLFDKYEKQILELYNLTNSTTVYDWLKK